MKQIQMFILVTVVLLLTACQVSTPEVAPMPGLTPPAMIVDITDETCPSVEIESGVTVGWRNTGRRVHTLQSQLLDTGGRLFDSGTLQPGDGFAMTFIDPGIIQYVCSEDGSLKGTITVIKQGAQSKPVQAQLGSGVAHSCLLTQHGEVFCWGQGAHPNQEVSPDSFGKPYRVDGLDAKSLGAGWYHTCIATREGQVNCWGQNVYGQLGNGATEDSFSPVTVTGLEGVIAVTAGATHSCALTGSGEVYCWGQNIQGQLGDGTTTDRPSLVKVSGLTGPAVSISAGPSYSCALMANGQVECWGQLMFLPEGQRDQLHASPVNVPHPTGMIEKMAAGDNHLCILTKSHEVSCEGLFFPTGTSLFDKPTESLGELQGHIVDILAETDFTCVLADSGEVYCWGDNYFDQIGDGTFVTVAVPKQVSRAGNDIIALGGGHYTACALSSSGKVDCWGDTSFGQTGDGTARWK